MFQPAGGGFEVSEFDITKGEKVDAASQDRAKMGVSRNTPPAEGEVEGQAMYWKLVQCPWCGNIAWCYVDTDVYLWFTCCNCGGSFKA
jgi:hypothetical protein